MQSPAAAPDESLLGSEMICSFTFEPLTARAVVHLHRKSRCSFDRKSNQFLFTIETMMLMLHGHATRASFERSTMNPQTDYGRDHV